MSALTVLRRLAASRSGVAATEFALSLPLLLTAGLYGVETANQAVMQMRVSQIAVLIGSFLIARILIIVTDELGYEALSRALAIGWLGMCAYTWVAPEVFREWLKRELGTVTLDPDY